jgi:hypothetical protein
MKSMNERSLVLVCAVFSSMLLVSGHTALAQPATDACIAADSQHKQIQVVFPIRISQGEGGSPTVDKASNEDDTCLTAGDKIMWLSRTKNTPQWTVTFELQNQQCPFTGGEAANLCTFTPAYNTATVKSSVSSAVDYYYAIIFSGSRRHLALDPHVIVGGSGRGGRHHHRPQR